MKWLVYQCDECGIFYEAIIDRCPTCGPNYGWPTLGSIEDYPELASYNAQRVQPTQKEIELVEKQEEYWKKHASDLGGGCGC